MYSALTGPILQSLKFWAERITRNDPRRRKGNGNPLQVTEEEISGNDWDSGESLHDNRSNGTVGFDGDVESTSSVPVYPLTIKELANLMEAISQVNERMV